LQFYLVFTYRNKIETVFSLKPFEKRQKNAKVRGSDVAISIAGPSNIFATRVARSGDTITQYLAYR